MSIRNIQRLFPHAAGQVPDDLKGHVLEIQAKDHPVFEHINIFVETDPAMRRPSFFAVIGMSGMSGPRRDDPLVLASITYNAAAPVPNWPKQVKELAHRYKASVVVCEDPATAVALKLCAPDLYVMTYEGWVREMDRR